MKAKEMFEKLGYELYPNVKDGISYKMKWEISSTCWVDFDFIDKTIDVYITSDSPFEQSKPDRISLDLLQAINKQVEELGWNK